MQAPSRRGSLVRTTPPGQRSPETWVAVLNCLDLSREANAVDPDVPISDPARKIAKGIPEYAPAHGPVRVPLRGLVAWVVQAVMRTEPLPRAPPALAAAPRR